MGTGGLVPADLCNDALRLREDFRTICACPAVPAAPVPAPVAPPPVAAPVEAPVAAPVAAPVTVPVDVPVTVPVAVPVTVPVTVPIAVPVVTAPVVGAVPILVAVAVPDSTILGADSMVTGAKGGMGKVKTGKAKKGMTAGTMGKGATRERRTLHTGGTTTTRGEGGLRRSGR